MACSKFHGIRIGTFELVERHNLLHRMAEHAHYFGLGQSARDAFARFDRSKIGRCNLADVLVRGGMCIVGPVPVDSTVEVLVEEACLLGWAGRSVRSLRISYSQVVRYGEGQPRKTREARCH